MGLYLQRKHSLNKADGANFYKGNPSPDESFKFQRILALWGLQIKKQLIFWLGGDITSVRKVRTPCSLFYFDLICVVCILHTCNSSAHAQSVTESLSLSQNKRLPFYLTLWDCLTCHYTHIYPIWPMNLSTYLSISRQKNPICEKKFLILVKLDRCHLEVGPSWLICDFYCPWAWLKRF